MTSKLTEFAQQKKQKDYQTMSRESVRWLQNKVNEIRNPSSVRSQIANEKDRHRNKFQLGFNTRFLLGGLYFFYYNPKLRNDLPYYDIFPLVMPLEKYNDGFLGLNIHYLPVNYRIAFMSKMMGRAIYDENDEIKRIKITYDILSSARRYREFRPCVKRYLNTQIRSKIIAVMPDEWDVAMMLPVHQFRKAPASEVWSDSLEEIRNS